MTNPLAYVYKKNIIVDSVQHKWDTMVGKIPQPAMVECDG